MTSPYVSATVAGKRLDRLDPHLSSPDRTRLREIVAALGDATSITVAAFAKRCYPDSTRDTMNKALTRLRDNLDDASAAAQIDLHLVVSGAKAEGDQRELGFVAAHVSLATSTLPELDGVADRTIPDREALVLDGTPRLNLSTATSGKPLVRVCFTYAETDDPRHTKQLRDLLQKSTKTSDTYEFVITGCHDALAGEDPDQVRKYRRSASDLEILAISCDLLGSDLISDAPNQRGPFRIPILLSGIPKNADLRGLKNLWAPLSGKSFVDVMGLRKNWVNELDKQLHLILNKYANTSDASPARAELLDLDGIPPDRRLHLEGPAGGIRLPRSGLNQHAQPDPPSGGRLQILAALVEWAVADDTPLACVLGEYGIGKTITCQQLVRALEQRRELGQPAPQPLYFDLRNLANIRRKGTVPTLEELLDECIKRGWAPGETGRPTAVELLDRARRQPTLFVFDGLDEALVHLDTAQGVAFTRELLSLRPRPDPTARIAGADTKILISCRTHYFPTLRDQSRHFTEQGRDRATEDDYTALLILPLRDEQIRDYLQTVLGQDGLRVMELLRSVHDLSQIATRPFTLAKLIPLIPLIEQRRAQGAQIHATFVYEQLTQDWLSRDEGKHTLKPTHKLMLMGRLAAWAWRRGGRLIEAEALDDQLHLELDDPVLKRLYGGEGKYRLEGDLRTATFLVRQDDADGSGGFRFAHSSMQEFFLARYLLDAVAADRRTDWQLPPVSQETLRFLGQLLADHADIGALLRTLSAWGESYLSQASEIQLRYALLATAEGWPCQRVDGIDLTGASLDKLRFAGSAEQPLNLRGARLAGANLRSTQWQHVDLSEADLTGAHLDLAVLQTVDLTGARMDAVGLRGAYLRDSRVDAFPPTADVAGLRTVRSGPAQPQVMPAAFARLFMPTGHTNTVTGAAVDPHGKWLATTSNDRTVRIYDTHIWKQLHTLTGHTNPVTGAAVDPHGKWLATTSNDHTVRIYDTHTWNHLHTLTGHTDWVTGAAVDPHGKWLATTSNDRTVRIYDTHTWHHLHTLTGAVTGAAVDPHGNWLATTSLDRTVRIYDTHTWNHLHTLTDHTRGVTGAAVDPHGKWLATTSRDGTVRIYDTATWEHLHTLTGHTEWVTGAAVDPHGKWLATTSTDHTVRIYDTATWEHLHTLTGHTEWVTGAAVDPHGKWLATTSTDHTVRIYDTHTWQHRHTLTDHTRGVTGAAVDPHGKWLATTSNDRTVRIYDTATWEHRHTLTGHTNPVTGAAADPHGKWLATTSRDGTVRIYDTHTWNHLHTLTGHTEWVTGAAVDPHGKWLATTSTDHTVRIYDTHTWQHRHTLTDHTRGVTGAAVDPHGKWLATTSTDHTVRIYDTHTWEHRHTLTGHTEWVTGAAADPHGNWLATTSGHGTVRIYDTATWEHRHTLTGHTEWVTGAAADPHGNWLATTSRDGTVRIYDTHTWNHLHTLTGHTDWVTGAAVDPHGNWLATTSGHGTVRIYDTATWELVVVLALGADRSGAVWTVDQHLLNASDDAWRWLRVQLWDEQGRLIGTAPYEHYHPTNGTPRPVRFGSANAADSNP